jgi:hypothetical protein
VAERAARIGVGESVLSVVDEMGGLLARGVSSGKEVRPGSYLSHVALGLGRFEVARGSLPAARIRFEEAVRLDPANVHAKLERTLASLPAGALLAKFLRAADRWWRRGGRRGRLAWVADRLRVMILSSKEG